MLDEVPRRRGRGRAGAVFAAGPVVILVVSQIFFLLYAVGNVDPFPVGVYRLSDILRGQLDSSYAGQVLLALAGGLLAFGLLALLPIPPLDGLPPPAVAVGPDGNGVHAGLGVAGREP